MSTASLTYSRPDSRWTERVVDWRIYLILGLACAILACRGVFSFENEFRVSRKVQTQLASTVMRSHGVLGYGLTALLFTAIGVLIVRHRATIFQMAVKFKVLTGLALLAVLSVFWSQEPERSALFGASYLLLTLFGYYLVQRFEVEQLKTLIMITGTIIASLSVIMIVVAPGLGITHGADTARAGAWNGIFIDRTSAGKCLTFLISPVLVRYPGTKSTIARVGYLVALGFLILQARALTSLIAVAGYMLCISVLKVVRKHRLQQSRPLHIISVLFLVALGGCVLVCTSFILPALGRDVSLTGRTDVWAAVINCIADRPLLGYGFYAFWLGLHGESAVVLRTTRWFFGYAHNGLLEIWLQLGIIGVILFSVTFLKAVKDAWYCFLWDVEGRYDWYITMLVLTSLLNISEETVLMPLDLLALLYVVMCCGLSLAVLEMKAQVISNSMT